MDGSLTLAISNFQDLTDKMEHTPYIENGPNIHPYFGSSRNTGVFQPMNNHEGLNRLASLHKKFESIFYPWFGPRFERQALFIHI